MSKLEFHPERAIGEGLLRLDKQELLQFVSRLCLHLKAEVGSRAYRGGIFPENICADGQGNYAIGPARMEKWSGQELEFVAPELYWHGDCSPASDVYSLALLVYYGLGEGKLPFETATSSGQLARMSGKALPAPKNAGKRLAEVLEKATAFKASERYQSPEELQIMLESCMDNKYLGGASGAETVFQKDSEQLSDIERMMVDIIERGEEEKEQEQPQEPQDPKRSLEEIAGLEKPEPVTREREDVSAMVEEFFGSLGETSPEEDHFIHEEAEDVRVYEPSREKKDRQPIPILTEEKYPELAPVVLQQQPRYPRAARQPEPVQPEPQPEPAAAAQQQVKKRRNLRPVLVVLILCLSLVAGALAVNLFWPRTPQKTQINPTPNPQNYYETTPVPQDQPEETPAQTPTVTPAQEQQPAQPRYRVIRSDMTWTSAQAACREQGGYLAVISTRAELDEITALAEQQGISHLWIGCHRENDVLIWENGEPVIFLLWAEGEPSLEWDGIPEDYIMLDLEDGVWVYNDNNNDPASTYPNRFRGQMGYVLEAGN